MRATIKIKNLALRTVIGLNEWERGKKQDVLINVDLEFEAGDAVEKDSVEYGVDYKAMTKKIISGVEGAQFFLLEALAGQVLRMALEEPRVLAATVEVDKPHSLRFAESVSVVVSARKQP